MHFPSPLIPGILIKRYKRFLADVALENGEEITAHVANTGSMMGLTHPGCEVWLSQTDNPKRKLKYSWELVRDGDGLVGINTMHPNKLVSEAIENQTIKELTGYCDLRREVKYGKNSRIDIFLRDKARPDCYVEVKNVTLRRANKAVFPDAVTTRGTKHLAELSNMVANGARAVMVYLVQREDCTSFGVASDIDPTYASAVKFSHECGVELICYSCILSPEGIRVDHPLNIEI